MKAIVIHKQGSSDELKYEEIPVPEPGQNEVGLSARPTPNERLIILARI